MSPVGAFMMPRMMGAAVLYLDGIVFAVVADEIWFKADAESAAIWEAEGCERFAITLKDGSVEHMNYRRAPADVSPLTPALTASNGSPAESILR